MIVLQFDLLHSPSRAAALARARLRAAEAFGDPHGADVELEQFTHHKHAIFRRVINVSEHAIEHALMLDRPHVHATHSEQKHHTLPWSRDRMCGSPAVDGYAHVNVTCLEHSETAVHWNEAVALGLVSHPEHRYILM